jgi:hypothetical protein
LRQRGSPRVLREAGYELVEQPTRPHPDHVRSFERATPNQLWQSDLFTFMLKRQNRRVYLVAFMDDHSRFITAYGLHGSQSAALVIEVVRAGIAGYGVPREVLTDNGTQYGFFVTEDLGVNPRGLGATTFRWPAWPLTLPILGFLNTANATEGGIDMDPQQRGVEVKRKLLKLKEAAEYINMSPQWLYANKGTLVPFIQMGGTIQFDQDQLDAYIEASTIGPKRRRASSSSYQPTIARRPG